MNALEQHRRKMQAAAESFEGELRQDYEKGRKYRNSSVVIAERLYEGEGLLILEAARESIVNAPSWPKLLKAVFAFRKTLSGWAYPESVGEIETSPEYALTAHAGVYHAKSARAQTLEKLAGAVFSETGLPRKPKGRFRGENGLDISRLREWFNNRKEA